MNLPERDNVEADEMYKRHLERMKDIDKALLKNDNTIIWVLLSIGAVLLILGVILL